MRRNILNVKACTILCFFILSLSVCSTASATLSTTASSRTLTATIYVDDDNTQGPWDGSLEHPYQKIQDGLDHSHDGDIVFVFSGIYHEHVTVKTIVSLIGENKETTIIDADNISHCIYLVAGTVRIQGFTLRNSGMHGEEGDAGVGIRNDYQSSHQNIIQDNIMTNNYQGVELWMSDGNRIANNTFFNNKWNSINIESISSSNQIINNTILGGGIGIFLGDKGCSDVLVQGNLIENHTYGIMCYETDWSVITRNVIRHSLYSGIIFVIGCSKDTVSNNIIMENNESGVVIEYGSSDTTTIEYNNFINNTAYAVGSIGSGTKVQYNYITGSETGIIMEGRYSTIHGNNLTGNNRGVAVAYAGPCIVTNNVFLGNQLDATFLDRFLEHALYFFAYQPRLIRWGGNYWEEPLSQPKYIKGTMNIGTLELPWVNVDFRPASSPQGTWGPQ